MADPFKAPGFPLPVRNMILIGGAMLLGYAAWRRLTRPADIYPSDFGEAVHALRATDS